MKENDGKGIFPRSVVVVSDDDYRRMAGSPQAVDLLKNQVALVVPLSAEPEYNGELVEGVRELLVDSDQLVPGALLIKSPFGRMSFEHADVAIEAFASAKYLAVANVARLLGAREVHFMEAKVEVESDSWAADLTAKLPAFGGKAEARRELKKKVDARMTGRMVFPGSSPSLSEATEYLNIQNLAHDDQLQKLVAMRTGENPVEEYSMRMSGTREAEANFTSAISIANAGPMKALNVGAKFVRTAQLVRNVEIVIDIKFPSSGNPELTE